MGGVWHGMDGNTWGVALSCMGYNGCGSFVGLVWGVALKGVGCGS